MKKTATGGFVIYIILKFHIVQYIDLYSFFFFSRGNIPDPGTNTDGLVRTTLEIIMFAPLKKYRVASFSE